MEEKDCYDMCILEGTVLMKSQQLSHPNKTSTMAIVFHTWQSRKNAHKDLPRMKGSTQLLKEDYMSSAEKNPL